MNADFDMPTTFMRYASQRGRKVLQQWWVNRHCPVARMQEALTWPGEWRDVPRQPSEQIEFACGLTGRAD